MSYVLYYAGVVAWLLVMVWLGGRRPARRDRVPMVELSRFRGNDHATQLYTQRRDALGYGVRVCPTDTDKS